MSSAQIKSINNVNEAAKVSMRSVIPLWITNIIVGMISGIIYKLLLFKYFGGIEDIALHENLISVVLVLAGIISGIIVSYNMRTKYEEAENAVFPVIISILLTPLVSLVICALAAIVISILIAIAIYAALVLVIPFVILASIIPGGPYDGNHYDDYYDDDDDYVYDAVGDWR